MYYIGSIKCRESDVKHYGVIGMKWGERRYQNPDGTLTEEGKRRYGENGHYEYQSWDQRRTARKLDRAVKKAKKLSATGDQDPRDGNYGVKTKINRFGQPDLRSQIRQARAERAVRKVNKYDKELKIKKQRDLDIQEYGKKMTTAGAYMNTLILGNDFMNARARGESVASAYIEQAVHIASPVFGRVMTNYRDQKKYGNK